MRSRDVIDDVISDPWSSSKSNNACMINKQTKQTIQDKVKTKQNRSVELFPGEAVPRHGHSGQEEDDVDHPPDTDATQRQQLGHAQTAVAQAEPVHPQDAQEDRVEHDAWEVEAVVPGDSNMYGKGRHTHLCTHSVFTLFLQNRPAD